MSTSSSNSPRKSASEPQSTNLSGAERLERYVAGVLSGKILACKDIKLACRRHRKDLKSSKRNLKKFPWYFSEEHCNRFIRFHEGFPHVKDDFRGRARDHERFNLEDWQCFVYGSIFGWVDKQDGSRRFNEAYVEVPRKNGKTPNAAVVGLFGLTADGEYGAEIFAGASSREQAGEVGSIFDTARALALASPEFRQAYGVWVNANSIVVASKNASFKKVKGNPQDGPAPHMVLADERHEYKTDRIIEWARNGMVSRRQPLLLSTTTAGHNTASACYRANVEAREILAGRIQNDRQFCFVSTIDRGMDWRSKRALRMANPNYGVSINPKKIEGDQQQARQSAAKQAAFKTKNLNIWVNAGKPWMDMDRWDECRDREMKIEQFASDPCILSVDLASRKDTVSTPRLFKRRLPTAEGGELQDHYYCFTRGYLNSEQVRDEKNTHFADWVERGMLIETPGNVTDYLQIADDVAADALNLDLREMVFDPFHAAPFAQILQAREDWPQEIEFAELKQSDMNMSPAMQELEAAVLSRRFHHDGNEFLAWQMGNVRCIISRKDYWYPDREIKERKIDGPVSIILGLARLMVLAVDEPQGAGVVWA
jgi:phage terminase large subunit-like protein